ncbi:MAG: transporter related protein [Acidimicrobiales bacterium]|nr:transporter related protein [Acidimicrobiales bacterium]
MTTAPPPAPAHGAAAGDAMALVLDDVTVTYDRRAALEAVSGTVATGTSVALIGPNGAGKSTLLRAILGLVPLERGRIEVLGSPPAAARRRVAYVPQAEALDPEFPVSVRQVVLMGRYREIGWLRRVGRDDRAAADAALDRVGLADHAAARFGTLSGGQRQRVLLARAIAQGAKLLLLDEPFNGVDATTQDRLLEVMADLQRDGISIVMSTHDLAVAHLACGEACLLNRHLIAFGPTAETLTPEHLHETYGRQAIRLAGDHVIVAK